MNGNKYKILIIEDDEHINNLVATLLWRQTDIRHYRHIPAKTE